MTTTDSQPPAATTPVHDLEVTHLGDDLFRIGVRGHTIVVDQPLADGGGDEAPTPTELFVASLASCVAFHARRYLARHGLPTRDLRVDVTWSMADRPARVGDVGISLRLPEGVPADRRAALLAVASHCTVHNSLERPPAVQIHLA